MQKLPGLLTALDYRGIKLTARISSAFGFRSEHTATPTGLSELLHQAGHRRGQAFAREKRQSSQVIRSTPTRDLACAAKKNAPGIVAEVFSKQNKLHQQKSYCAVRYLATRGLLLAQKCLKLEMSLVTSPTRTPEHQLAAGSSLLRPRGAEAQPGAGFVFRGCAQSWNLCGQLRAEGWARQGSRYGCSRLLPSLQASSATSEQGFTLHGS